MSLMFRASRFCILFFFLNLRDSQVPQLENLGAKSLCLCPHTCAYFHSCTSPFSPKKILGALLLY